ncbi:type II toxin-antitoxin system Phd/YefM family antitoxin [Sutterella sp.]|uniref:type II toxin-antitoxin system Phd/YefM family antitoxin n=1 Tax=Sutterella sp. TaxID=1981025 RepID=UPI003FD7A3AD
MASVILADTVASITELKKNPSATVQAGNGQTVAILNRNVPEFYCVPAQAYAALMELVDDEKLRQLVLERQHEKLVDVDLTKDLQ